MSASSELAAVVRKALDSFPHRGQSLIQVVEALGALEARARRYEEALRDAPMPRRESIHGETWDEYYDEWWHAYASEAALTEEKT